MYYQQSCSQIALWSVNDSFFSIKFFIVRFSHPRRSIENRFLSESILKRINIFQLIRSSKTWFFWPVVKPPSSHFLVLWWHGLGWYVFQVVDGRAGFPIFHKWSHFWFGGVRRPNSYQMLFSTNSIRHFSIYLNEKKNRNSLWSWRNLSRPLAPAPKPPSAQHHSGFRSSPFVAIAGPPIIVVAARVAASHLLIKCLFTRCFHLAQASLDALVCSFFWRPLRMVSNYKSAECAGIEIMLR